MIGGYSRYLTNIIVNIIVYTMWFQLKQSYFKVLQVPRSAVSRRIMLTVSSSTIISTGISMLLLKNALSHMTFALFLLQVLAVVMEKKPKLLASATFWTKHFSAIIFHLYQFIAILQF